MKARIVRIDNGPENPSTGVISTHSSVEKAWDGFYAAQRRRAQSEMVHCWHPYQVQFLTPEGWRVSRFDPRS